MDRANSRIVPINEAHAAERHAPLARAGAATSGVVACVAACVVAAGCASLGQRVERGTSPLGGTQDVEIILHDLAANDTAVQNFKATGAFTLESPEFEAVKVFKLGRIFFRRPDELCVEGRKYGGSTVFRLTCVGSQFLIEFPFSRDDPYYQLEGEHFDSVPFSVSPSDIAREMFFPEAWADIKPRKVRMTDHPDDGPVVLEIPRRSYRRRLVVVGPPWDVVRSERLDKRGRVVAVTSKRDHRIEGGVRFPAYIAVHFPGEQTRMTFTIRRVFVNTDLDDADFDIEARAREAGLDPARPTAPRAQP